MKALVVLALASLAATTAEAAASLSGIPLECQAAHEQMRLCMEKAIRAGAPESIRPQCQKQLDDSVTMWRAMKGNPGVLQSCSEIAADRECAAP